MSNSVNSAVRSFQISGDYFEENLSNSITTPNYIIVELEVTRSEGGIRALYCSVFEIAQLKFKHNITQLKFKQST